MIKTYSDATTHLLMHALIISGEINLWLCRTGYYSREARPAHKRKICVQCGATFYPIAKSRRVLCSECRDRMHYGL
ncbi:MAG: hypothetical protein WCF84_02420 [Anaerolineae bacterium]